MNPDDLLYSPTHEWVLIDGEIATVGLTDFAVGSSSSLIALLLPNVGREVDKGEAVGEIESIKVVSDIFSPVAGQVVESKHLITMEDVGRNPLECWLFRIYNNKFDREGLLTRKDYQKHCESI